MDIAVRKIVVLVGCIITVLGGTAAGQSANFTDFAHDFTETAPYEDNAEWGGAFAQNQRPPIDEFDLAPEVPWPEQEGERIPLDRTIPAPVVGGPITPLPFPTDDAPLQDVPYLGGPDSILEDSSSILEDSSILLDEAAPIFSSGEWLWQGAWYTQQDVMMMLKSEPSIVALAVDLTSFEAMSTTTNAHQFEPGARLTLGHILGRDAGNRDHAIEFTFLGLFEWAAQAELAAVSGNPAAAINTLLGPGFVAVQGFSNADRQDYVYRSDLQSIEVNLRARSRLGRDSIVMQPDGEWVRHGDSGQLRSMVAGFRAIKIKELFLYHSQQQFFFLDTGDVSVRTENEMFGVQVGLDFVEQYSQWSWAARTRVGGLVNFAGRQSDLLIIRSQTTFVDTSEGIDDEYMVFLAELDLTASYQIHPHMALRASYNLLFLNGLALAAENLGLNVNSFPPLNLSGNALYQGLSLGFEMVW